MDPSTAFEESRLPSVLVVDLGNVIGTGIEITNGYERDQCQYCGVLHLVEVADCTDSVWGRRHGNSEELSGSLQLKTFTEVK